MFASRKLNGEPNGTSLKSHSEKEYKDKSKQGHSSRKEQFLDEETSQKTKVKDKRDKSLSKKQKK
uniref:Uncharacterized protein n=2 Tax=Arion vulgaris TaxID=1028688 RepID=A0A0B7AHQ5_9EUPU